MKLFRLKKIRENLSIARFNRQELSGSLGDLGTFLPIILGLSYVTGLYFPAMLFWAGVSNIATGLTFAIPMPVQPMKAIAAVAFSEGMSSGEVYASGIIMALFMLLIWSLNLTRYLDKMVPIVIVRGIQLTIGVKLLIKGSQMILFKELYGFDSIIVGVVGTLFVLMLYNSEKVPTALILFAVGLVIVFIADKSLFNSLNFQPYIPVFVDIKFDSFHSGFLNGVIPQLPLTLLNSVIAVSALSFKLYNKRGAETRNISLSVGLINLSCLFGAMPMCHGSGGLAAQSRFGARTNGSILMLGTGKVLIAVLFGTSIVPLISAFPESILGVMLIIAGIELCSMVRDQKRAVDIVIIILMVVATLATGNLTTGFLLGLLAEVLASKLFSK